METLDQFTEQKKEKPGGMTPITILSYIGNTLWIILFAIYFAIFEQFIDMLNLPSDVDLDKIIMLVRGVFLFLILVCIVSVFGVVQMNRGKKSGFTLYAVSNGIFGLLLIIGSFNNDQNPAFGIIVGGLSLAFIFFFSKHLKWMR